MRNRHFLVTLFIIFCCNPAFSQDTLFARKIVDTLSSSIFWGRGYTNNGVRQAAHYIASSFKTFKLKPLTTNGYFQKFNLPVNTFPAAMQVSINGIALTPGEAFIVAPESRSSTISGKLTQTDTATWVNAQHRIIVNVKDKLTWSVSTEVANYTMIDVDRKAVSGKLNHIKVDIDNKFIPAFETENVAAMVQGTAVPDSFIYITAHYDHLGGMGKHTYFPGANDNASGIALLLNLARYYALHPPRSSRVFIAFSAEEAGLLGSKYYTENPLSPLQKIKFLINTDLAGTGSEGITVVNATEFPNQFALMNQINDKENLLVKINARGKAANSDHYFFTEKGVPAFFFYTLGGIKAYHDVFDKSVTLPLTSHTQLFHLLIKFNEALMAN